MFFRICRNEGGEGGGGAGDGSTTVTVDHGTSGDKGYTPPAIDMATAIPPEFREDPSLKGKDFVSVIKEHVNLQKLLGQRPAGIPTDSSTDDEWNKFLGAMRPKDLNEYQFPETEWSKAYKRSPEYEKAIREILAETGVPKKMFGKGVEKIESFLLQSRKAQEAALATAEKTRQDEFEKLLDSTYGKDKQMILDRTKKLMADSVPAEMKEKVSEVLKNISNDNLFVLTSVLNGIHAKYISEDNPPGTGSNSGADLISMQSEAEEIMKSAAYKDFRNPGHDAAKEKVRGIFQKIAAAKK